MRQSKRISAFFIMISMMVTLVPIRVAAAGEAVKLTALGSGVLTYQYDQTKELKLQIQNTGSTELKNVKITPQLAENTDGWPFEIENMNYNMTINTLGVGKAEEISYSFTTREDVPNKYYNLKFNITSDEGLKTEQGIYVKTVAKPVAPQEPSQPAPSEQPTPPSGGSGDIGGGSDVSTGGGISNGEPSATSGGTGSVPRVIVTGFTTEPAEVKAGSNFKLIIHLKNTSKKTAVRNMLFDLNAPTTGKDEATVAPSFLPVSGSSAMYLDGIGANGQKDISIDLNAKSDLTQKPYSVEMSMKYEDGHSTQFESASSISIPVKQDPRFEFSKFTLSPESIAVGEEANVMCNLYNLGQIKLYNVRAKFESKTITAEDVFVGNVEPGATAAIDGMVTGKELSKDKGEVKLILSYEDEGGVVTTVEKQFELTVTEPIDQGAMIGADKAEVKKGLPIIPIVIGIFMVGGAIAGVVIYKKKKKKKLADEEEGLADEFERLTEDEL
ncbi:MAG: hypothetical protein RSC17_09450 [Lachnospiraceae bacterium]